MMSLFSSYYIAKLGAKYYNFKQNIEHNRLGKQELPERKIGEKKAKQAHP